MKASIQEYKPFVKRAWDLFKVEWGFFIIAILILLLVEIIDTLFGIDSPTNSFIITLVMLVASFMLTVGFIQAIFDYIDTKKISFETFFGAYSNPKVIVDYALGYMLFSLITYGLAILTLLSLAALIYFTQPNIFTDISLSIASNDGKVFEAIKPILPQLIVIGALALIVIIYTSTRLGFTPFLIIDKNLKPVQALKKSLHMTSGHFWYVFLFSIFLLLFNVLGFFCLVIGLFVTVPVSIIAYFLFYRSIVDKHAF